jgi:hypothetical protein
VRKVIHHTLAVVTVQNLLMKKLGLVVGVEITTEDFEAYIRVFREGLMLEQCKLTMELFLQQEEVTGLLEDD